jgi:hypothetical protein
MSTLCGPGPRTENATRNDTVVGATGFGGLKVFEMPAVGDRVIVGLGVTGVTVDASWVPVSVGVTVGVGVDVLVLVDVDVGVFVAVEVLVVVGVDVRVGVFVVVSVGVNVGVDVLVEVSVGVGVLVAVRVTVSVGVEVEMAVVGLGVLVAHRAIGPRTWKWMVDEARCPWTPDTSKWISLAASLKQPRNANEPIFH